MSQLSNISNPIRKVSDISLSKGNIIYLLESFLEPITSVITLWIVNIWLEGKLGPNYLILSVIIFSLTFPSNTKINIRFWKFARKTFVSWVFLSTDAFNIWIIYPIHQGFQ
jgi:putative colanic acid biosynthesis UDP-glucose lipid carrier transferase